MTFSDLKPHFILSNLLRTVVTTLKLSNKTVLIEKESNARNINTKHKHTEGPLEKHAHLKPGIYDSGEIDRSIGSFNNARDK